MRKVLVVNRGEIARRIFRACQELGLQAVAVFSDADADAAWLRDADEKVRLPGTSATDTYLNQARLLTIARDTAVDAVHPGYGFLSENHRFAAACAAAGLLFVGPSPEAIRLMGDKAEARRIAQKAGVPVIPGVDGAGKSAGALRAAAEALGFPVLVKAAAGGGGKGMRVVTSAEEFDSALQAARSEARSSFGDDHILLEKFFTDIRHIEVQVLGDLHGHLVHLLERECSIQRRHQKIVEESPSPALDEVVRGRITAAALALAREVSYSGAGTVEFILTPRNEFYLLEMNTRLQVEHPVTELVAGIDLVTWQLRVARGEPLTLSQDAVSPRGHALECRVYAEDPANGFLPSIGKLAFYRPPAGPGIRVDDGIASGSAITPYYDPMLAKIIAHGATREEARQKMVRALSETVVLGVTTNIPYLLDILQEPHFVAGETPTSYLERHFAGWQPPGPDRDEETWLAIGVLEALSGRKALRQPAQDGEPAWPDPWAQAGGWRNVS